MENGIVNPFEGLIEINTELLKKSVNQPSIQKEGEKPIYDIFRNPAKFQPKAFGRLKTPKRKQPDEESEYEKIRPRTPSGQVLTSSVQDLKKQLSIAFKQTGNMFENASQQDHSSVSDKTTPAVNKSKLAEISEVASEENNFSPKKFKEDTLEQDQHLQQKVRNTNTSESNKSDQPGHTKTEDKEIEMDQDATEPNPEVVDVRAVVKMLKNFKIDLQQEITKEIKEAIQAELAQKPAPAEENLKIEQLEKRIQVCEFKEKIMAGTIIQMREVIAEMQDKMEKQETNGL